MASSAATPAWAADAPISGDPKDKAGGPGGQWKALNVAPELVRALLVRKFKSPTPIQRASIPSALSTPPRDILGMARTGSGKTLAYLIPLLQRLGATHVNTTGPRSLILCPSRELAVQIYSVGKDLARGMSKSKSSKGKGKGKETDGDAEEEGKESLRWAVIIGGEGLDGQFEKMSNSPDIVIATPGRFLHLLVEMHMDLRHLQTVIYDEADRLFEMGFDAQLREILHRLPPTRQNLLFSATLPSSVAEFAKAGLVNPLLVRLDAEHKISEDLDLRFFAVKPLEKEATLLVLLRKVLGPPSKEFAESTEPSPATTPQAIVFVATKHHVDYIAELLRVTGYRTSLIYSSLDQVARQQQLRHFRDHSAEVLVVTDVAARGLDIPVMDHVINYDFTTGPRVFVHRVGRTARAGRKGTAYSLITKEDYPYLCDLQTFLGDARLAPPAEIIRSLPVDLISENVEYVFSNLEETAPHITALRNVMRKGQGMFERSRAKANPAAYRGAKALGQALSAQPPRIDAMFEDAMEDDVNEERARLLATVAAFTPAETVFEVGKRESEGAVLMKKRRTNLDERKKRLPKAAPEGDAPGPAKKARELPQAPPSTKSFKDPAFYLSHTRTGASADAGYSLKSGASLPESLASATFDLTADEGTGPKAQKASQLSWDKKKRKFVQKSGNPENGVKMIRSESGALLPATYNSGKFDEWRKKRRGVGEGPMPIMGALGSGRKGRHGAPGQKKPAADSGDGDGGERDFGISNVPGKSGKHQPGGQGAKGGKDGNGGRGAPGKKGGKGTKQSSGLHSAEAIRQKRVQDQKRKAKSTHRRKK
ncbi:ATP-dependent RNA helicase DBP10 [Cryptococcus sp. DSM 104549]